MLMTESSSAGRTTLPRLLTIHDVATALLISERTAYRLVESEIPAIRVGPRGIRVREDDLVTYLARRRERSSA